MPASRKRNRAVSNEPYAVCRTNDVATVSEWDAVLHDSVDVLRYEKRGALLEAVAVLKD